MTGVQAPYARIPLADGTLVGLDHLPDPSLYPDLQAVSDVLGTGWYAADAARVTPGSTAVVIGDGAVGLMAVIAAKHYGAERIIAMSRPPSRQALAKEFGATDIVAERGEEGIARVMEGSLPQLSILRPHKSDAGSVGLNNFPMFRLTLLDTSLWRPLGTLRVTRSTNQNQSAFRRIVSFIGQEITPKKGSQDDRNEKKHLL